MSETVRASNRLLYRLRVVVELLPRAFSFLPTARLPREVRHQREAPAHTLLVPEARVCQDRDGGWRQHFMSRFHPYGPGCRWQDFRTSGPFSITPPRTSPSRKPCCSPRPGQRHTEPSPGGAGAPWTPMGARGTGEGAPRPGLRCSPQGRLCCKILSLSLSLL